MSHDIRAAVLAAITRIAPEVDPATLKGDERLRQQVDIDSMDFLNMVIDLHRELGVDIPESD
jgi:acyl carrier protein